MRQTYRKTAILIAAFSFMVISLFPVNVFAIRANGSGAKNNYFCKNIDAKSSAIIDKFSLKYNKITDEFFDELEELLIMADISVDTVLYMIDKLKKRCKEENIETFKYLKEVIVDELLMLYVDGESISSKLNIKKRFKNEFYF